MTLQKQLVVSILLVLFGFCCADIIWDNTDGHIAKVYELNLDLSPTDMWREVVTDHKTEVQQLISEIFAFDILLPDSFKTWVGEQAGKYHDQKFVAEVRAVAALAEVSFNDLFFITFMDEMLSFCTSIVTTNTDDHVFHSRNLDYYFSRKLAMASAEGHFYKGGKLLYKAHIIAGLVGFTTGMRMDGFSVSMDTRTRNSTLLENIEYIVGNNTSFNIPWAIRQGLENNADYASAVQFFSNTEIDAPVYFILAGNNAYEGIILARGQDYLHSNASLSQNADNWFMVQTNYDRELADPILDERRVPAENRIEAHGQADIDEQWVYDNVMTQFPNLRLVGATIMTLSMSAQTNYFNMTIWYNSIDLGGEMVSARKINVTQTQDE